MVGPLNTAFCLSFTLGMSEAAIASMVVDPSGNLLRRLAQFWGRTLCERCGVTITVEERARVDWDRPMVVMANHQSHLDIPVLYATLPRPVGIIAKEELFRIPLFGSAMRALKCVSIDRADQRSSRESLQHAADEVRAGNTILVFPEGTRSPDGKLLPLKKGPFHLVQSAQVPVLPVGIRGTRASLAKSGVFVRPAKVHVTIGSPILPMGTGQAARERLREKVAEALNELGASPELHASQKSA